MKLVFRYILTPTSEQEDTLMQYAKAYRWVYNWSIKEKSSACMNESKNINHADLSKKLTEVKQKMPWLKEVPSIMLQEALRYADNNFTAFLKNNGPMPAPMMDNKERLSFFKDYTLEFGEEWKVKIPKMGWVGIDRESGEPINIYMCAFRTLTITRQQGTWHCEVKLNDLTVEDPYPPVTREASIGLFYHGKVTTTENETTSPSCDDDLDKIIGNFTTVCISNEWTTEGFLPFYGMLEKRCRMTRKNLVTIGSVSGLYNKNNDACFVAGMVRNMCLSPQALVGFSRHSIQRDNSPQSH